MLGTIAVAVGVWGRTGTAGAEVLAAKVSPPPPTEEVSSWREAQAWKRTVKKRERRFRAGVGLAIGGGCGIVMGGILLVAAHFDTSTRRLGRSLVSYPNSATLGFGAVFMSLGGLVTLAGVPLMANGALRPEEPARPVPVVYASIGPGSATLGLSF
jgi:hypothetical protein